MLKGDKGWTDAALISGAQHIGLSPAAIGLLPRGPAELVEASLQSCYSCASCQPAAADHPRLEDLLPNLGGLVSADK